MMSSLERKFALLEKRLLPNGPNETNSPTAGVLITKGIPEGTTDKLIHSIGFPPLTEGIQSNSFHSEVSSSGDALLPVEVAAAKHLQRVSDSQQQQTDSNISFFNHEVSNQMSCSSEATQPAKNTVDDKIQSSHPESHQKKRKPVPVKREQASVTDAFRKQVQPTKKRVRQASETAKSPLAENLSPQKQEESVDNRAKSLLDFFPIASQSTAAGEGIAKSSTTSRTSDNSSASEEDLTFWRLQCELLRRKCQEKDSELAAIANNRTLQNTSLHAALKQREKEMKTLQFQHSEEKKRVQIALEAFVRMDATRASRELRDRLATDSLRIGRFVQSRVGMRTLESWQDGHALIELKSAKKSLEAKRMLLEQRHQSAVAALQKLRDEDKENRIRKKMDTDISARLSIVEAYETSKLHMYSLQEEEKTLQFRESQLVTEKSNHIRALKNVVNEDGSRFSNKSKVRASRSAQEFTVVNSIMTRLCIFPCS